MYWILMIVFLALAICAISVLSRFRPVRNEISEKETRKHSVFNIISFFITLVLAILYIPLSCAGVATVFFSDNLNVCSGFVKAIVYISIAMGLSLPFVSVASMATVIILRIYGKRKLGLIIQFVPLLMFLMIFLMMFLTTLFSHFNS